MKNISTLIVSFFLILSACGAEFTAKFSGQGYITQNHEYAVSDPAYTIKASNGLFEKEWITKNAISFSAESKTSSWTFAFAAPKGQVLAPGLYKDAARYAFAPAAKSGMEISGEGRGSNEVGGWFKVLEIEWNPTTGKVTKAAIDFCHLSENKPDSVTKGSIRFNSTIPATPDPKQ